MIVVGYIILAIVVLLLLALGIGSVLWIVLFIRWEMRCWKQGRAPFPGIGLYRGIIVSHFMNDRHQGH